MSGQGLFYRVESEIFKMFCDDARQSKKHSALANPPDEPFRHIAEREATGMRPGGFGILMAKELVDDLLYNEQGNEVLLIKYLDKTHR